MTKSADLKTKFLDSAGWSKSDRKPLAGDASGRSYERIFRNANDTAVLLDAGPAGLENLQSFIHIADHLSKIGLSAPQILYRDQKNGYLLLEDFGDGVFARLIQRELTLELPLCEAAVDTLTHIHCSSLPTKVQEFQPEELADFAAVVYEWYRNDAFPDDDLVPRFVAELTRLLALVKTPCPVLALRDYHSENLIWLPERTGIRRVGLLDFQDAFLCHPAYDLVSFLRDARRDISEGLSDILIDRYIRSNKCEPADFHLAVAVYGAQRNLRILGIFARLSRKAGKPHYLNLIPRVWRQLSIDLAHPALNDLRRIVLADLPEPTDQHLRGLREKCTNHQDH